MTDPARDETERPTAALEPVAPSAAPQGRGDANHVVAAAIVLLVLVRLVLIGRLGLFNDEAYYWEWSRRLAPSYFDHPPLVAWILAASTRLLGRTELAVHLPALVLSCASSLVLYRLALDLFPGQRGLAWWSVLTLNVAPLFGVGAVFTTPDAPCAFFWLLTAWLVWRAVHGADRLWYLAGASAGLGLLSKYTFVLLPPAILLFLLRPAHRAWFRRKELWGAVAIMALASLPVLVWNAQHGWASLAFHLVERHDRGFQPARSVLRFFTAQQSLSPLVWAACIAGLVRSWRAARAGSEEHAFLFWCAAVMLAVFGGASVFTFVNPNWFAPAFLTLLIPGSEVVLASRSRLARVLPAALGAALTLAFYVQSISLVAPIPARTDLATDLVGWPEVGARLRELTHEMPGRPFVFSRRLQLSALAAFYGGDELEVTRLGGRRDAYDDWTSAAALRGRDAIYFCDDLKYWDPADYPFRRCERLQPDLHVFRHERRIRTFSFWRCSDYEP